MNTHKVPSSIRPLLLPDEAPEATARAVRARSLIDHILEPWAPSVILVLTAKRLIVKQVSGPKGGIPIEVVELRKDVTVAALEKRRISTYIRLSFSSGNSLELLSSFVERNNLSELASRLLD